MDEILLTALIGAGAGLAGVVVGSVLSLVGQYIIFKFEDKRWKKEKRIELLKSKKELLEKTSLIIMPGDRESFDEEIEKIIEEK